MTREGLGLPDLTLKCRDCGADFVFSEGDQSRFAEHGYAPPRRCKSCRARQRTRAASTGTGVGTGDSGRAPGGVPQGTPAPGGGAAGADTPRSRPKPAGPMHDTRCSECDAPTQVPFVPDGLRPVFCLACLKKRTR
ncbi:MAG: hypothetical protein HMLKMBBP_00167 [Planctomycetes bacterium]|nr:hypothetical protein [Planctomycetota bacterium]